MKQPFWRPARVERRRRPGSNKTNLLRHVGCQAEVPLIPGPGNPCPPQREGSSKGDAEVHRDPTTIHARKSRAAITLRPLGTLAAHLRKGFEIQGGFTATLDGQSQVRVTCVLERTAFFEHPQAMWAGRMLARLDRFTVEDPATLHYTENKRWLAHQNSAAWGRKQSVKAQEPTAKVGKPEDPNKCPGSNQPSDEQKSLVTCPECHQRVYTYPRREGMYRQRHLRSQPS